MLKKEQNLNSKIFDKEIDSVAIRVGFGEGLLEAGKKDKNVVGLCADLVESTKMDSFAKEFPNRFIEVGVAEQNLASVASGMAAMGKIPFISSYAMFSPGRNWEQIRTTICYNDVPVKIAGSHAGISVGPDGGTHQAIEDIAITRVIPNMVVISPCDYIEARKATILSAKTKEPTYIRLAREATPVITSDDTPFEIGKMQIFYESKNKPEIALFATGALVYRALKVASDLDQKGIGVFVINVSTIKPLDISFLKKISKKIKGFVSIEEHQKIGGLGSALAEWFSQNNPLPQEFIGVDNLFGQSGTPEELIKHYKMDEDSIKYAVKELLKRV